MKAETAELPAQCPPHDPWIGGVVIDLPPPVSVNETRRVDWEGMRKAKNWRRMANNLALMWKIKPYKIPRFEIRIVLDESTVNCDADNAAKIVIDYLRLIEVIEDDSKKHMRRVVIEWGEAPFGCRAIVRPCS